MPRKFKMAHPAIYHVEWAVRMCSIAWIKKVEFYISDDENNRDHYLEFTLCDDWIFAPESFLNDLNRLFRKYEIK